MKKILGLALAGLIAAGGITYASADSAEYENNTVQNNCKLGLTKEECEAKRGNGQGECKGQGQGKGRGMCCPNVESQEQ